MRAAMTAPAPILIGPGRALIGAVLVAPGFGMPHLPAARGAVAAGGIPLAAITAAFVVAAFPDARRELVLPSGPAAEKFS
ncbi:MAG: hypothetical protein EXS39_04715 [Opitutaceae bacterium]|nr:hypothetical protein [Opitutaceae bacterium]